MITEPDTTPDEDLLQQAADRQDKPPTGRTGRRKQDRDTEAGTIDEGSSDD